ncbi:hypothetical protein [Oscillatoria salina]|nr:hypothetical protein [Oscillatoria salina]MBZ8180382.1 hypothetical protein [Oscillatoria salina IIICB1]NET89709.1 hypothetical protein [Kamptonema sp. SIO1D9]
MVIKIWRSRKYFPTLMPREESVWYTSGKGNTWKTLGADKGDIYPSNL